MSDKCNFCANKCIKKLEYKSPELCFISLCEKHEGIIPMNGICCECGINRICPLFTSIFQTEIKYVKLYCSKVCMKKSIINNKNYLKSQGLKIQTTCHCGEIAKFWCSKCRIQKYCSVKCQKKDWKNHKELCS